MCWGSFHSRNMCCFFVLSDNNFSEGARPDMFWIRDFTLFGWCCETAQRIHFGCHFCFLMLFGGIMGMFGSQALKTHLHLTLFPHWTFLRHLHSNFFKWQNAVLQGENKPMHKGEVVKLNVAPGYSLHFSSIAHSTVISKLLPLSRGEGDRLYQCAVEYWPLSITLLTHFHMQRHKSSERERNATPRAQEGISIPWPRTAPCFLVSAPVHFSQHNPSAQPRRGEFFLLCMNMQFIHTPWTWYHPVTRHVWLQTREIRSH